MRQSVKIAAGVLVPVLLVAGAVVLRGQGQTDGALLFEEVRQRVAATAIDSLTGDAVWERAARGLVTGLHDPYAGLYSPAELASFSRNMLRNDYGGVGMQIQDQLGTIVVGGIFPRTPAAAAGVQTGDRILSIDSVTATGLKIDEVSARLIGQVGTSVTVTFGRPGVKEPLRMRFTRAVVHVPAVPYVIMLEGNVGYIPLQRFNDASAGEVRQSIVRLRREGARSFVLDLRGNPGGSLEESVAISNLFLPPGRPIVSVRYRGKPAEVARSSGTPVLPVAPLVVLLDGSTASASEIVAGALQDHDRALIVGTTSYGKGVVQSLFPLHQGWGLKLTTAAWFTPSGRSIQRSRRWHNGAPDSGTATVADAPDSLEGDSVRHTRPVFHSDGGRTVYGGGGITPDVIVSADTLTTPEQVLLRALAPKSQQSYAALYNLALGLKPAVHTDFQVQPAWRERWHSQLDSIGVRITPQEFEAARPLVNRLLENRVSSIAFGDSSAFRRSVPDDGQLIRALEMLRTTPTQAGLLAQAGRPPG